MVFLGCLIFLFGAVFVKINGQSSVEAVAQPVTFRLDACTGGSGYACITKPDGCTSVDTCELVAAWMPTASGVEFTLIGSVQSNSYVSIGFGPTDKMDKTKATICSYYNDRISVYNVYNDGYSSITLQNSLATAGISHAHGEYKNGRLACRFTRAVAPTDSNQVAQLNSEVYVSLCSGPMSGPTAHEYHTATPIVSSPQSVNKPSQTGRLSAVDEKAKDRPLWKAHGILMLISWVLIVLVASLQPRYYRRMWPNKKFCGNHVWFALHQPLMIIATILFTIGFILALVAADGKYVERPNLPYKAHPILGLIALILGWLNPIIALFRCKPAAHYRPVFNWIHFFVGTLAIVFAVVTCFIGLSFDTIRAPAWTAYVLVVAVIFHLIVEILLELAGCFYYSKNKEKMEQFELRQQAMATEQDPDPVLTKPKPSGTAFKNIMVVLHAVVMTILVLAIVLGIALN